MEKVLNLKKTIYALCMSDPTFRSIMLEMGVKAVAAPKTLGALKNRTLPEIVPIRGMGLDEVIKKFEEHGYAVVGRDDN